MAQYIGKYRGTVINNADPEMRGRLIVSVPDVPGLNPSSWAEACSPLAGPVGTVMGCYMVPPIGTAVWVEFESGNPDYPIWVGCRWDSPDAVPQAAREGLPFSPPIVIQTTGQHTCSLSDRPGPGGGIVLKSPAGATIIVNDTGIYVHNGKGASLSLVGTEVFINGEVAG